MEGGREESGREGGREGERGREGGKNDGRMVESEGREKKIEIISR